MIELVTPSRQDRWIKKRVVGVKARRAGTDREREMYRLNCTLSKVGGQLSATKSILMDMIQTLQNAEQREVDMELLGVL